MDLLAEALLDERAERFEEVLSIPGWEGTEEILLNSVNHGSPLTDLALSGLGDGDDSCAAVGLGGSALRESSRLQLIDRDDHRRLVQADQLGELLLRVLAGDCRREDVEVPVGDAQRAERCVDLAGQTVVRLGEQPAQILGETVGRLHRDGLVNGLNPRLGGSGHRHKLSRYVPRQTIWY